MGSACGREGRPASDPTAERRAIAAEAAVSAEGAPLEEPLVRSAVRRKSGRALLIAHNPSDIGDEYDMEDKAGEGTQGVVFRAKRRKTGVARAIKKVPKKNVKSEHFRMELAIMKQMDHPNIIKLFETFEDAQSTYLVMEYCAGGELFDKVVEQDYPSEPEAAITLQQILRATHYLHENHVAHRDLKPENLIFSTKAPISEDNPLKLIDFGMACVCGPGQVLRDLVGTPYYIAPQVITRKYDKQCDVWSCGVIMYTLLCGNVPFNGRNDQEILGKVREGIVSYKQAAWHHVSAGGRALVRRLLTRNPKERPTAEQALRSDWIKLHAPGATAQLQEDLADRLRRFRKQNRLKQAALGIVASELSDSEIRLLRNTFTALDCNGDGLLTHADIREGLRKAGLQLPAGLQELFHGQANNMLDYTEFLAATIDRRRHLSEQACRVAFGVFDVDGDGRISARDVAKVFQGDGGGRLAARAESQRIVKAYSREGGSTLDFEDFQRMVRCDDCCSPRA